MKNRNGKQTVLLVSSPGIIREATTVMLESIPQVDHVEFASGALSAIEQSRNASSHLLVVDANLPTEEMESLVHWSKHHRPATKCIVLARGMAELEKARSAGADTAMLRSSSAQQIAKALRQSD